jgi:hypothetical protein
MITHTLEVKAATCSVLILSHSHSCVKDPQPQSAGTRLELFYNRKPPADAADRGFLSPIGAGQLRTNEVRAVEILHGLDESVEGTSLVWHGPLPAGTRSVEEIDHRHTLRLPVRARDDATILLRQSPRGHDRLGEDLLTIGDRRELLLGLEVHLVADPDLEGHEGIAVPVLGVHADPDNHTLEHDASPAASGAQVTKGDPRTY